MSANQLQRIVAAERSAVSSTLLLDFRSDKLVMADWVINKCDQLEVVNQRSERG